MPPFSVQVGGRSSRTAASPGMPRAVPNALPASYFGLPPREIRNLCIDGIVGIPLNGSLPLTSMRLKLAAKAEEREHASGQRLPEL